MGDGLKRAKAAATKSRQPFIPGFIDPVGAAEAGEKFFARTNGRRGVEGVDFHLVQNAHGRWHFEEGKAPVPTLSFSGVGA